MYAIAIITAEGEESYWNGGEVFSIYQDDAVRFVKEVDAEDTIPILEKAGFGPKMRVVELPEEADCCPEAPKERSALPTFVAPHVASNGRRDRNPPLERERHCRVYGCPRADSKEARSYRKNSK
jgi:hypothetical protein